MLRFLAGSGWSVGFQKRFLTHTRGLGFRDGFPEMPYALKRMGKNEFVRQRGGKAFQVKRINNKWRNKK